MKQKGKRSKYFMFIYENFIVYLCNTLQYSVNTGRNFLMAQGGINVKYELISFKVIDETKFNVLKQQCINYGLCCLTITRKGTQLIFRRPWTTAMETMTSRVAAILLSNLIINIHFKLLLSFMMIGSHKTLYVTRVKSNL